MMQRDERAVTDANFNEPVGELNKGDEEVMGRFDIQGKNAEGQIVVDFVKRMEIARVNTFFQKRRKHKVTYKGGLADVTKEISDCKVVVGESVARQHRMVIG